MQESTGFSVDTMVVVGGAARNAFWMQNKADMIGKPIEVPDVEDATPRGAAMLAGIGVGAYRDEKDAFEHVRKDGERYEPDTARTTQYAAWFPLYKRMYPALRDLSHSISEKLRG
jgi:xylulokinase